jgi:hypothetical protein
MQVIIKVPQTSAFSKYNFLTFEVEQVVGNTLLSVKLEPGKKADFSYKEIIIVDFENAYQAAYNAINWNTNYQAAKLFSFLSGYSLVNNICHKQLEYNCPA